jgi:hypothetical protein
MCQKINSHSCAFPGAINNTVASVKEDYYVKSLNHFSNVTMLG